MSGDEDGSDQKSETEEEDEDEEDSEESDAIEDLPSRNQMRKDLGLAIEEEFREKEQLEKENEELQK